MLRTASSVVRVSRPLKRTAENGPESDYFLTRESLTVGGMGADFISLINVSRIILRFRSIALKASVSPSKVLHAALKNIKE